jgi:hypothetical protein
MKDVGIQILYKLLHIRTRKLVMSGEEELGAFEFCGPNIQEGTTVLEFHILLLLIFQGFNLRGLNAKVGMAVGQFTLGFFQLVLKTVSLSG